MLLLQSIIVYTLFALAMYCLAKGVDSHSVTKVKNSPFGYMPLCYWGVAFVFCLVSGIRWDVGVDHISYVNDYISMQDGTFIERERGIEPAYLLITKICAELGLHYSIYIAILAFLQIYFILLAFRSERKIVPILLVLIVMGGYYFSWMNGIRQNIVACSFVFACKYIVDRNWKAYLIWILIAYTMHVSALLLIPIYIFAYDKTVWNRTWLNMFIFLCCVIVGMTPSFVGILSNLSGVLSMIGYDYYSGLMTELTDSSNFHSFSIGPRVISSIFTYATCIYLYSKTRQWISSKYYDLMFKLFFIGACGYYLLVNTTGVFTRPLYYFIIFALPITAYALCYLKYKRRYYLYIILFVASMSFNFFSCYADANALETDRRSQLYQFCFNHWNGK